LDREAFSITAYDLNARVEPEQHRLGVRGRITLRNDSPAPQKIAVLQISSSLNWRSIKAGNQALQIVTQDYTSDIDHTGSLSEAIVTLPQPVAPKGTIDLLIGYEGTIVLDATRLARIGTPQEAARNADWDQIDANFTAVRGAGYVAWYPIATDSANLSEDNDLQEVLRRWKAREAESEMTVRFDSTQNSAIVFSGEKDLAVVPIEKGITTLGVFSISRLGLNVPTFAIADYRKTENKVDFAISFFPGKEGDAASYADVLGNLDPLPGLKRGALLQIAQIPNPNAAPFASGNLLLMPLGPLTDETRLTLVYALARQRAHSPRLWISEGLAHFAQVSDIEQQHGRKAALDYLEAHKSLLQAAEKQFSTTLLPSKEGENLAAGNSLINTADEIYLQSKAMWVWWMLHDMMTSVGFNLALSQYFSSSDKDPSRIQKLLEKPAQRDLEWFFDDWVYRDRGLPDFKIESAFSRSTMTKTYIVAVTVENLGTAGAEVPVVVKFAGGQVAKRLEVRAKSKATIRIETPAAAQQIQVNDGAVPESDTANNTFKVAAPQS
jgi:hypothetical protein